MVGAGGGGPGRELADLVRAAADQQRSPDGDADGDPDLADGPRRLERESQARARLDAPLPELATGFRRRLRETHRPDNRPSVAEVCERRPCRLKLSMIQRSSQPRMLASVSWPGGSIGDLAAVGFASFLRRDVTT